MIGSSREVAQFYLTDVGQPMTFISSVSNSSNKLLTHIRL